VTRPSTDHVTINDDIADGTELYCGHCGESHHPILPIPALALAERIRGFVLMHRLCPKPEAPSPQLPLPGTEQKPVRVISRTIADPVCLVDDMETEDECCARTVREQMAAEIAAGRHPLACFGIDASNDEPAPEIDPPGPYARFEEMYPSATDSTRLATDLWRVLEPDQIQKLDSGIFNAVANWARIEKAHAEAGKREPIAGLTLPRREPMPEKLADLLGVKPE
jgi:hypothetical protein